MNKPPPEDQKRSFWVELFQKPRPNEPYWTQNTRLTLLLGVPIMLAVILIALVIVNS